MTSFCWSYGRKDELAEEYRSYMPQNKRGKLNTTSQNSANSAVIDEDASDKYEDGVDDPEIVSWSEDNEDEDDGESQDTPPVESNNSSTLHIQ